MNPVLLTLLLVALLALLAALWLKPRKLKITAPPLSAEDKALLMDQVPFYRQLGETGKAEFEERIQQFLSRVKITGVRTTVSPEDRLFIGASAIIPIFNFKGWEYVNLREVLLYPDAFSHEFAQQGTGRNVLGMVGTGAMNGIMILSQHELRQAFLNKTGKSNTAIHEFVHLVDKTDGSTDGIPEFILGREYILPWVQLMHRELERLRTSASDIDPYGATNEAEFFAVVSEYFFERPELLKAKHPELYALLSRIFGGAGHGSGS